MAHERVAASALRALRGAKYISLTTYRRSGEGVATPVWFAQDADHLYVETGPRTGKVKRIQHTPRVTLASCTFGGKLTGPTMEGNARVIEGAAERQRAERLVARKYGIVRRLTYGLDDVLRVVRRRPLGQFAYVAITLAE